MLVCRRGLWNPRVNVAPIYGVTSKIESLVVTILLLLWLWLLIALFAGSDIKS